jgi:DNA polymerase III sliding clamp (beta) subunit (PCNA family)
MFLDHRRYPRHKAAADLETQAMQFAAADVGAVAVSRADALALFAASFAAAADKCLHLCGLSVSSGPEGVIGVSTDGYRLARRTLPNITGWSTGIIVPTDAIKIINKLFDKSVERVFLRHSAALLAVETPAAVFISRLIDSTFSDYARVIPKSSDNTATVARTALLQALARLHAVGARTVQLRWTAGEPMLHLTANDDTDVIDAETAGNGKVALAVDRLAALLDEFTGTTINLYITDAITG